MASGPECDLRDRDWEVLLRSIESGNCVLLLGPNLDVATSDGARLNLCSDLAARLRDELDGPCPDHGNFSLVTQLFENETSRDDLEVELVRYFRNHAAAHGDAQDPAFQALAEIPFSIYLSLRHDSILQEHLRRQGREPRTDFYDFIGDRRDTIFAGREAGAAGEWGSVAHPLVYQLLGTLEADDNRGTAVITENDHIRFLEAVVSENPKLPTDLTNQLRGRNFLFIGFGMHNFYLRILMHVLNLARSTKSFAFEGHTAAGTGALALSLHDESVLFFRSTGFNTLKIMQADPAEFLGELSRRWQEKFPEGSYVAPETTQRGSMAAHAPSVFISYVSENEAEAQQLSRQLAEEGLEPWLDTHGLRVGDRWNDRLEDTISSDVDFFIVLQSNALARRRESYVHREVDLALERQRLRPPGSPFIFPVLLEPDAERLDAIERARIQSMPLHDLPRASSALAKQIRREHARWQKR